MNLIWPEEYGRRSRAGDRRTVYRSYTNTLGILIGRYVINLGYAYSPGSASGIRWQSILCCTKATVCSIPGGRPTEPHAGVLDAIPRASPRQSHQVCRESQVVAGYAVRVARQT